MSPNAQDVIERLPYELEARLAADPYFLDIPVVVADEGNVEQELDKKRSVVTTKSGKRGAAVIVLQIVGQNEFSEVKFGPLRLHPAFLVIEQRELNRGPNGTGKSARQIARRIVDVIVSCRLEMLCWEFVADQPTIEPIAVKDKDGANLIGYQVNFWTVEADAEPITQMTAPVLSAEPGEDLTITSDNPGAEIYFTINDSYPWKGNPMAVLYSQPVPIPDVGFTIRACAYQPGTSTLGNDGGPIDPSLLNTIASPVVRGIVTKEAAPPVEMFIGSEQSPATIIAEDVEILDSESSSATIVSEDVEITA